MSYYGFEETMDIAQDILKNYQKREKDVEDIAFTANYIVTEIIYLCNKKYYIIKYFPRKNYFSYTKIVARYTILLTK